MLVRLLGSAAGGGVPQWNCRCSNCAAARAAAPNVRPRTQSSLAISADGQAWFLLNVSPDIRQQTLAFPALGPRDGEQRGSAIAGCVLTDAELDHVTGLLLLREGPGFGIACTPTVRSWLNGAFPIEPILAGFCRPVWSELKLDEPVDLLLRNGNPSGLRVRPFAVDPHVPRYARGAALDSVIGLDIEDGNTGGRLVHAPCVASLGDSLRQAAERADAVFLDGTFWDDDEPLRCGIGSRTARHMGHLPVTASLDWLSALKARQRVYMHINNTNPMLDEAGAEYAVVTGRGVRVGADGDAFQL